MNIEVTLRKQQLEVFDSLSRFGVLLAHRRLGKTWLAVWLLIVKTLQCKLVRPRGAYYAPTYSQARRIAWDYAKAFCQQIPGTEFNESDLRVKFSSGAELFLGSADNPEASRGIYLDFVVLDEPSNMPSKMWTQIIRPALADRQGGALFIGTPCGRNNLFYDTYQAAATDPEWKRWAYKASETGIIPEDELQSAQRVMSHAEYAQEFEVSFDAAVKGAYWADAMSVAEATQRIGKVIHDPLHNVHIVLDLGMNDATAAWFFQLDGEAVRIIDHAEYTNTGLPDIVADWRKRRYTYGKVIAPPDINVRSLSTGITRKQTLSDLGCDVVVSPKHDLIDGIEQTRGFLSRCWFDRDACKQGIEALRQYRSDWQDKHGVLLLKPLHDWTSHSADALRYLAVTGTSTLSGSWGELDYTELDRRVA